jgi:hypothetical protein
MAKFENLDLLSIGNTIQLSGAIWTGDGKTFLCLFPGEQVEMPVDTLEMTTDEWQQFLRQTDIMEVEVLAEAPDGKMAKAIIRKSARQIAQRVSWEVYHRDDFKCRYCGQGPGIPLTVDHLVLWESGGPSTKDNLLSSCKKCNKTRGNTEYADWLGHPYYKKVSQNLPAHVLQDNLELVAELAAIPRMVHKPNKRK